VRLQGDPIQLVERVAPMLLITEIGGRVSGFISDYLGLRRLKGKRGKGLPSSGMQ